MNNNLNNEESKKQASENSIEELLFELNENDLLQNLSFTETNHETIDIKKVTKSLEAMKENATFKKFNTYQTILNKMPNFVITKKEKEKEEENTSTRRRGRHLYGHKEPRYYDIYTSNDKICKMIGDILKNTIDIPVEIISVILQYFGKNEFLFSIKESTSGAMTLSIETIRIGDALTISQTYSEKSGQSNSIIIDEKYDKKLYMYIGWILYELSDTSNYKNLWNHGRYMFNFNEFMKYEIEGNERPAPPERTWCIVGDCMIKIWDKKNKKEKEIAAKKIRAGDMISTSNGKKVKVVCTVTQIINDVIDICQIGKKGKCLITPEHPFRYQIDCRHKKNKARNEVELRDCWKIPYKEVICTPMYVDQVNNFVLESEHYVVVDNVECITLGHMFDDPIVKHKIWGSKVICDYLKTMPLYPNVIIHGALKNNIEQQIQKYQL